MLTVCVLILCVLGLVAALRMPVQMIPNLDTRIISVDTGWPGATPQDIEKEILIEQERYLDSLPNLVRMESYARTGSASIELEFPFGVDINEALIRVANALSQVPGYPENVDQPKLNSSSFSHNSFMYFSLLPKPGNPLNLDMNMIGDFVDDNVRPRMERVNGVSEVEVRGNTFRQIQVKVDPTKLAQRNLTLSDVRAAIQERMQDTSAGDIDDGKRRYLLRTIGRVRDVAKLENIIVSHQQGANIHLKDIASVKLDHYESRGFATIGGERAITLAVNRELGSNVIDIKEEMLQTIDALRREVLEPNGMQIILIGDDVRYVQSSVRNVFFNLCLGALLACAIMYWFLRSAKATLICLMGIPVCTIAAFLGLLAFDRTINVISLAGVAFAIGMTLDNSIVVLESIESAKRRGLERMQAAIEGVSEVWTAVIASSATTVLVFAPILFIQEEAGQLYSDIAIAISASILASMLFALLIVPTACANFGLGDTAKRATHTKKKMLDGINGLISHTSLRMLTLVLCAGLTLGIAYLFMPAAEYLPEGEEPKAFTRMFAPPGYNVKEMTRISEEILTKLEAAVDSNEDDYDPESNALPPLEYYSMQVSAGVIWVMSEPKVDTNIDAMMNALTTLFESYPGMRAFSNRGSIISSNQGGTRAVNLNLSGPSLADLYQTATHVIRRAETLFTQPRIDSDPASLSLDQPLIEIHPRWDRLAELGMNAHDFGFLIAAYSDGAYVDEFILDDNKVDIFLYSDAGVDQSLGQLSRAPVRTPGGDVLPLNALAELRETVDSDELRRVDGRRTVSVYIIPPEEIALETAVGKVRDELLPALKSNGEAPSSVSFSITGAADQLESTRNSLMTNLFVSLILIYLLMVAIFANWKYPVLILVTVPLGIAGGIIGIVTVNAVGSVVDALGMNGVHQPFDMITMLGFVILLGTVVNNPILIVEKARANLAQASTVIDAVKDAVESRLRPIMMSTATTVMGLAPLVILSGAGTELYRGIGIVVLVGIAFSTFITLTFLPCLLVFVLSWQARSARDSQR
nr:efflux RND transporter permease subunit [Alteromonas ponticola]